MKGCFFYFILAFSLHVGTAQASVPPPSMRLFGHVPSQALANATFFDFLEATTPVPMTFVLPLRNREVLEALIQHIYDPSDREHYGKYLSHAEFVERFAPTQADYDKVIAYAKSLNLTVTGTHSNRLLLNVVGTTQSVETAFNLRLHRYQTPSGRNFYAPSDNPEVPVSIAAIISGVVGLDNHAEWRPYRRQKQIISESTSHAFPSGPTGGYAPNDLRIAYNLTGVSGKGAGQTIALFELAGYQASDINEYTNHFGLPPAQLQNILVDGGSSSGIDAEVTLDIELALALAPESQISVYEGPNSNQGVLDTYNRIATDNVAKQVSTSWGLGEKNVNTQYLQAENAIFQQMAAQGQTIYAAAGDSGAYDNPPSLVLEVDDPASQPYVIGVGGTNLTVNPQTGAYQKEMVWNDGPGNGAGGGGVSTVWPIPSWQKNVSSVYSTTHRNVPDVSLNADPRTGYAIYYNGQWTIFGGTSCAAPLWAAFTALVNQELANNQKPVVGFANPSLYAIGEGSSYQANFHDITSGNNLYYSAGMGYDNASGWGSFNGFSLFTSLTQLLPPPSPAPLLIVGMNHSAPFIRGGVGTYSISVSNQGNGSTSGNVTISITLPTGLTYRSLSGSGWNFDPTTLTCTQNNPLPAGASYSPVILKVNVKQNAPHSVTPTATVGGGGSASNTATNPTTVR